MATNVFALHLSRGLKEIVAVAKTHKTVSFALRSPLVPDHPRLLQTWPARERLEQGVVRDLASQVTYKETEMGRIPLQ